MQPQVPHDPLRRALVLLLLVPLDHRLHIALEEVEEFFNLGRPSLLNLFGWLSLHVGGMRLLTTHRILEVDLLVSFFFVTDCLILAPFGLGIRELKRLYVVWLFALFVLVSTEDEPLAKTLNLLIAQIKLDAANVCLVGASSQHISFLATRWHLLRPVFIL